MKRKAKLLTEDPVLIKNQNIFAKFLIKNDRGRNVRKKNEYLNLLSNHFKKPRFKTTHQAFIPYTWFTTICKK